MTTIPITVSGQQCTGDADKISLNMGNTCKCGQTKVGCGKLPPNEEGDSDYNASGETTLTVTDVDSSSSSGYEHVEKADDDNGFGRDKLLETEYVGTEWRSSGRESKLALAEHDSSQCRRRISAHSVNDDSSLSFSGKLTSIITTLNAGIGASDKRTKQHVSFRTSIPTTVETDSPLGVALDAPTTTLDGSSATMRCTQCRTSVGRECVVPTKVNLLRCETKLDELMQRVDSHYRLLTAALHEITAFEYALSHDGATGETMRKYGPLILADRYVVVYNYFVSGVQAELVQL